MLYRHASVQKRKEQQLPPPSATLRLLIIPTRAMEVSSPATSIITTRAKAYEKSAEFARLYYFFEKLTQPRNHQNQNHDHQGSTSREDSETSKAAADGPVPEDIAPLLKNLSAILTKDESLDGDKEEDEDGGAPRLGADEAQQISIPDVPTTASASTFATYSLPISSQPHPYPIIPDHASTRPRRNTVAASAQASTSTPGISGTPMCPGSTRFPLREKRYPFTFKLLLHKLYGLEDWAAKVQEVLAASQEQFRPLNSTPPTPTLPQPVDKGHAIGSINIGGRGGDGPCSPQSPGTTFSGSLFGSASPPSLDSPTMTARRRRAQSTSKPRVNNDVAGGAATPSKPAPRPPPSRAVKKRIVNRRRSTNGLGEGVVGKMGEWMYDAAVSSVDAEQADARGQDSLRRRKRVFSSVGFANEERRFTGRDVTNLNVNF
jgi:hypothetical protein